MITGNISGQDAQINADLAFSGVGTIGGSPEILQLDGSSRSTGSVTISASEGSYTAPVDNESVVPTLQAKIQHAQCDEAYGDWVWALEQEFGNQGFRAELGGSFMAVRNETDVQDQLYQLAQSFFEGQPPEEGDSPLFNMLGEYLSNINAFIDQYPDWSMDTVMNNLSWAEFFINELRNLQPCDEKFFGEDNVEYFITALTFQVQQLIIGGANLDSLDGSGVFQLMEVAARVGAFGPGASNPFEAVRVPKRSYAKLPRGFSRSTSIQKITRSLQTKTR